MKVSKSEVESEMTPNGGYTKEQLAKWGVPWPPPKGWKKTLTAFTCSKCKYQGRDRKDLNDHWLLEHYE